MKKTVVLAGILCLATQGCVKKRCGCTIVDLGVNISYITTSHSDLLNPATQGGIKKEDIDIYYLEDGVKKTVYNSGNDLPENFRIRQVDPNGKFFLTVFASPYRNGNGISTTYISLKNHPEDTLTTEISKGPNTIVTKTWLNGQLKWAGNGMDTITVIR